MLKRHPIEEADTRLWIRLGVIALVLVIIAIIWENHERIFPKRIINVVREEVRTYEILDLFPKDSSYYTSAQLLDVKTHQLFYESITGKSKWCTKVEGVKEHVIVHIKTEYYTDSDDPGKTLVRLVGVRSLFCK